MPRILITGLPNTLQGSDELRGLLVDEIPRAVERQPGFGIDRRHVYAQAVGDLADERPTRVVAFTIEGLIDRPERTAEMRCALCDTPFIPARVDTKFCSCRCRQRAYRRRQSRATERAEGGCAFPLLVAGVGAGVRRRREPGGAGRAGLGQC